MEEFKNSKEVYEEAYKNHYKKNNIKLAKAIYEKILELYPNSKESRYARTQLENIRKNYPLSIEEKQESDISIDKYITKKIPEEIIITKSPNIEGKKIVKYLEVLVVTKVVNIIDFSQMILGIQSSKSVANPLKKIKRVALKEIRKEALKLNADAIISLSFDFEEVGGVNGGMLMLAITGTPVLVSNDNNEKSFINKLEKLKLLLDKEILTQEEFKSLKSKIISKNI